jgi:hypothetical protein
MNLFLRNLIFALLCFSRATHAASPYDIELIGELVVINTTNKPVYIPVGDTDWQEVASNQTETFNICEIPGLMFSYTLMHSKAPVTLMFNPPTKTPHILAGIIFFTVDGKDQYCFLHHWWNRFKRCRQYADLTILMETELHNVKNSGNSFIPASYNSFRAALDPNTNSENHEQYETSSVD